jgi:hypothetical protein
MGAEAANPDEIQVVERPPKIVHLRSDRLLHAPIVS